jgi:catechol 2,3-dioxygenase-like lactoylglutathione lyase family enzyme
MFEDTKAFSGFAVDDLQKAQEFYGKTLGLKTSEEYGLLTLHIAGDRDTLVYEKPDHTPATTRPATCSPCCRRSRSASAV